MNRASLKRRCELNKSLAKAIVIVPRYILMLAIFMAAGELVFVSYTGVTLMTAGRGIALAGRGALGKGFFAVAPMAIAASSVMLILYRTRHAGGGFLPVVSYALMGLATWLALFPAFISLKNSERAEKPRERAPLAKSYFRDYGRDVVYMTEDFVFPEMNGVVVSRAEGAGQALSVKRVSLRNMEKSAEPFSDPLVKKTIRYTPEKFIARFEKFEEEAESAWRAGFVAWLCFASMGLALWSVYALSFCGDWPLVSVTLTVVMSAGTFAFCLLYLDGFFPRLSLLSARLARARFLSPLRDPLFLFINAALSLLFIALGRISLALRKNRSEA